MATEQKLPVLASIRFLTGPLTGITFEITNLITTLGRDRSNDIFISDQNISRFHARLAYTKDVWQIENLSQTNTITVDQQDVEQAVLTGNSVIELGSAARFIFSLPSFASEQVEDVQQKGPVSETEVASLTAMGIPSLEVTDNTTGVKKVYPLVQERITIGRDPTSDIVIDAESVSARHLQIVREGEQWVLLSAQSVQSHTLNGLLYRGQTISGNEAFRKPLARGDLFRIGDVHGNLVTITFKDGSSGSQEIPARIQPVRLGTTVLTIGRLQDNDVVLNHPQVSAHHARLLREGEGYRLTDLDSTNHTYVNGLRVTSQLLDAHDEIRIGPFRFIYTETELTQFDESEGIRIDALHLKKSGEQSNCSAARYFTQYSGPFICGTCRRFWCGQDNAAGRPEWFSSGASGFCLLQRTRLLS